MKFALKLFIAIVLLAVIIAEVNITAVADILSRAQPAGLIAALGFSLAIVALDAAFWTTTMRAIGFRIAFRPAVVFSLVGWFFANLAPSTVGADLFRVAQMRRSGAPLEATLRLVVAARLMSFATLLAVIAVGLPWALHLARETSDRMLVTGVFLAAVTALVALVLTKPVLARWPAALRIQALRRLADVSGDLKGLLAGHPRAWSGWIFASLQHVMRVGTVAAIAWSLQAQAGFADLFTLVPVALLVAMIPVSLGSWGVREASFIYFLGLSGIPPAMALAISIVYGLARIAIGTVGGVAWVLARREHYRFDVDPPGRGT